VAVGRRGRDLTHHGAGQERREKLAEETDDLLGSRSTMCLEENAEDFVRATSEGVDLTWPHRRSAGLPVTPTREAPSVQWTCPVS